MMTEIVVMREGQQVQAAQQPVEREATYQAALKLVARIDDDLRRGIRHYRNRAGELLRTLDEVVRAILNDDLMTPEEAKAAQKQAAKGGLDTGSAQVIDEAAKKILCNGCSLAGLKEKCTLCPGPVEFMAHLGELVEAALPPSEAELDQVEPDEWMIGPDQVRVRMQEAY